MHTRDTLAKYICDRIENTLKGYGRMVRREGDHALVVHSSAAFRWRVVVRRTGIIEFEPCDKYSAKYPVANLAEHVKDALADEYEFIINSEQTKDRIVMEPRALPKAPYPLPAGR